jgi:hypothetical protein
VRRNATPTLASISKIDVGDYLYRTYVEPTLAKWATKYGLSFSPVAAVKTSSLKTRDLIRIKSLDGKIIDHRLEIYEFVVLELCRQVLEDVEKCRPTYTLMYLQKEAHVPDVPDALMAFVATLLERYPVKCSDVLHNAYVCMEKNADLLKYKDKTLFAHQKQLFHVFQDKGAKLVLYTAPTGTGKTLSPLGLSEGYRVIFICAARHVGLALAKAAVSVQKRIAIAFGCETASDIRLHYFAASEFTRNRKSGGIGKVNNAVGDKVQLMICDVQSYLVAMHYMLAFSANEERDADLVTYWDEPTITMDYAEHPLHAQMQRNWQENQISKVVLSCATLPASTEIAGVLGDFASRFPTCSHHTIQSFESSKSISLWNTAGKAVLPHLLFDDGELLRQSVQHCLAHRELLRYLDLSAIVRFIENLGDDDDALAPDTYFSHAAMMTMQSVKEYYLVLLQRRRFDKPGSNGSGGSGGSGGTLLTTKDAHTLTDGPTIFLAEDVEKVGRFLVQQANIPATIFQQVAEKIAQNSKVQRKMNELEQQVENVEATESNQNSSAVATKKGRDRESTSTLRLLEQMEMLRAQIRSVALDHVYVPNTVPHQRVWAEKAAANAFVPSVDPASVREIMALDVTDQMKLLLLMGIGMFVNDYPAKYVEIMKRLAEEQRLFLILASSDYIYGTNFNFCHGFVGKDLDNMTFQKTIQAMGRIGRGHIQQEYTVRFRDDDMLRRLFLPSATNPEANKMNELFCSFFLA